MFGLSVISLLTGFAITTNYGHGGPARESDVKIAAKMVIGIQLSLRHRGSRLMVRLLRSSFDCSNVIKSELVGQDFTWWHTPQELLLCYDELFLRKRALVAVDKTSGRTSFVTMKFTLGDFRYSLEPASHELVGVRGEQQHLPIQTLELWGHTHYLFNITSDGGMKTSSIEAVSVSSPATTTPTPPGFEWDVVYGVLLVMIVLVVMLLILWVKRAKEVSS